jgi:mannose-6-phosphate isomerase-like protein (cupin superfamily)
MQGSGPPIPHIHPIDEWFYVMEGEMTVELGDQTIIGRAGDSLWIPRGNGRQYQPELFSRPARGRDRASHAAAPPSVASKSRRPMVIIIRPPARGA